MRWLPYILVSGASLIVGGIAGALLGFVQARHMNSQSEYFLALDAAHRSASSDLAAARLLREGRVEGAISHLERQMDGSLVELSRLRRESPSPLGDIEQTLLPSVAEYRLAYPWSQEDTLEAQAKSVLEPYMKAVP